MNEIAAAGARTFGLVITHNFRRWMSKRTKVD